LGNSGYFSADRALRLVKATSPTEHNVKGVLRVGQRLLSLPRGGSEQFRSSRKAAVGLTLVPGRGLTLAFAVA